MTVESALEFFSVVSAGLGIIVVGITVALVRSHSKPKRHFG